jgi:multidrug efflux pump subunit AcrA (membrane-fusion protein)
MFEVRLNVDANLWIVGESVRVPMPTSAAREVLAVPRDALVLRREGASVFRVNDDMTAEKISVITGLGAGSLIEVIGELDAGDTIVIRGAERLSTGSPVQVSSTVSRSDAEASPKME